jgi:hypothetical protein
VKYKSSCFCYFSVGQNNKSKQGGRKPALTGVSGKSAITGIVEVKVQSSLSFTLPEKK